MHEQRSIRERMRIAGAQWLLNIVAAAAITALYLRHVPRPGSLPAGLFLSSGLVSTAVTVSLLPGAVTMLLMICPWQRRSASIAVSSAWTAALTLLFVDTLIYGIFRYHFNGMVWNVLTTPGADEALSIGWRDKGIVLGVILLVFACEFFAFRWLWHRSVTSHATRPKKLHLRQAMVWGWILLPCCVVTAGTYAHADLRRDHTVMGVSRLYPIYPHTTIKRFARKYLGVELEERPRVGFSAGGVALAYPRARPAIQPDRPRPNIVMIVVDSLRHEMFAEEGMPRMNSMRGEGRLFLDHYSTGNSTRFGVFGLLYGLHGSYWRPIYNEHRSPVLIDTLLDLGYEPKVLTAASMTYPEFTSTAWVRIEDCVEDRLVGERPGGRDDAVLARFEQFIERRTQPFFAFLLLDAPHQSYHVPEEFAVHLPQADGIDYLRLAAARSAADLLPLRNRYRNAVLYADDVCARAWEALERAGMAANTIFLVTGDHGEEFLEHGTYGHTSNFTATQVHVPLFLRGPGIDPGEEARPTSHLDVPATLLELLGASEADRPNWTLGSNLLTPRADRVRIVAGWDEVGICTNDLVIHVPLAASAGTDIDVYDADWRLVLDDSQILEREGYLLGRLARDARTFLR